MIDDVRAEDFAHDRLTRITDAMTAAMETHPERGDEKAIIFLSSESDERGGAQMHGYLSLDEAIDDALHHVAALCEAHGLQLRVLPMMGGQG